MNIKQKIVITAIAGSVLTASCFGLQSSYINYASADQVAVRTPSIQSSEIFGGWGTKVLIN